MREQISALTCLSHLDESEYKVSGITVREEHTTEDSDMLTKNLDQ